jgi:hypothetical protein
MIWLLEESTAMPLHTAINNDTGVSAFEKVKKNPECLNMGVDGIHRPEELYAGRHSLSETNNGPVQSESEDRTGTPSE